MNRVETRLGGAVGGVGLVQWATTDTPGGWWMVDGEGDAGSLSLHVSLTTCCVRSAATNETNGTQALKKAAVDNEDFLLAQR